jgi:hypothetical protein
MSFVVS